MMMVPDAVPLYIPLFAPAMLHVTPRKSTGHPELPAMVAMYPIQQTQQAHLQQMELLHTQQVAVADIAAQTKQTGQGKDQRSMRSHQMCQQIENESLVHQKRIVVEAVESLYEDEIMPHHMLVLRRIEENYGERWSPQQLKSLCFMVPEVLLVSDGEARRYKVMLQNPPEGFEEFVDQSSPEDPYPAGLWLKVKVFLQGEAENEMEGARGWPGSRYEFAKWMRSHLNCLAEQSLGRVCHLVQLCISKKELLGYRQGNLVPFQLSDDCRKKSHALLNLPTQIQPGEKYVRTWEQAGELIARVLAQNKGEVQLSSLKVMCRKMFHMELSECALGHAKLSHFLQDHRLKSPSGGCFALEQHGPKWHIVHRERSERSERKVSTPDSERKVSTGSERKVSTEEDLVNKLLNLD
jgi:hypothetical protein